MNDGDRLLENPSMSKDAMLFNSYEDLKDAKLRLDDSDQQSSKQEVSGDNKTGKQVNQILLFKSYDTIRNNLLQFANPLSKSQGDGLCVSILTKNTSINANAVSDEKFLHHNNKNGTKSSCVSSCKRKPASPKKRLLAQESIAISAETGEIVDDCLSKEATCSDPVKTETLEMKKIVDGFRRKKYMKNNKSSAFSFVNNSLSVPDLQTLASILTNQPNQLTSFTKSKKDKNTITKDNDQIQSNKHSADLLNSLAAADIASTLFGSPHNVTALDAAINGLLLAGQGGCATTTTTTTNQLAPSDMIPLMNGLLPFVTTSLPANTLEGLSLNKYYLHPI